MELYFRLHPIGLRWHILVCALWDASSDQLGRFEALWQTVHKFFTLASCPTSHHFISISGGEVTSKGIRTETAEPKSQVKGQSPTQSKPATDIMASVIIPPLEKHTATVIFLHGLGDTGHGWSPVMEMIRSRHVKYICPHAPEQRVTLNMGMRMPAWFDIFGLHANDKEDADGIQKSSKLVRDLVEKEIESGIPSDRIVVGGFSQGAAVTTYTGLTYDKPLGGVVCLSGWLPLRAQFPAALNKDATANLKIFQAHGDADQVVSYAWGKGSHDFMTKLGLNVLFKTYRGMPHSATDEEIRDLKAFIDERLPQQ